MSSTDLLYALPTGSPTALCTQSAPCSIGRAVEVATAEPGRSTIRMLPGNYGTTVEITSGTVSIVGTGATLLGPPASGTPLSIRGSADVTVRGATIDLARGLLQCDGRSTGHPKLLLRDLTIATKSAILITACTTRLERVAFTACRDEGSCEPVLMFDDSALEVIDSSLRSLVTRDFAIGAVGSRMSLRLVNSLLDGGTIVFRPGDDASSKSRLELAFDTVYCRAGVCIEACSATNLNKTTLFENNIIFGTNGPDVLDGTHCTTATNVLFPQTNAVPGTNVIADPLLVDSVNHDFHLKNGSPAIDAAVPSTGLAPAHDNEGTARPQGAKPDIGAFERMP